MIQKLSQSSYPDPIESALDTPWTNPVKVGIRLGMTGALLGLGYSAINAMIRQRRGRNPPSIIKPILVGATIGAGLGYVGTTVNRAKVKEQLLDQYYSPYPKMAGLGMIVDNHFSKIAGIEKTALLPALAAAVPWAWRALMAYWTAKSGLEAVRSGRQAMQLSREGDIHGSHKAWGQAGLNTLFSLVGFGQAGSALKYLGRIGAGARGAAEVAGAGAKAVPGAAEVAGAGAKAVPGATEGIAGVLDKSVPYRMRSFAANWGLMPKSKVGPETYSAASKYEQQLAEHFAKKPWAKNINPEAMNRWAERLNVPGQIGNWGMMATVPYQLFGGGPGIQPVQDVRAMQNLAFGDQGTDIGQGLQSMAPYMRKYLPQGYR